MKKEPVFKDKDLDKIAKGLTVLPKKGIITATVAAFLAIGGGAGAATYFGIKSNQGSSSGEVSSQYTLIVKDNAVGHWVGDKIDLNDLDISKVDKYGKVTEVDKTKVTLSKDTLDREGEESIVVTDTESKAKSVLKISALSDGRVNEDIFKNATYILRNSFNIFKFGSFKYTYTDPSDPNYSATYCYRNNKEEYGFDDGRGYELVCRCYCLNDKYYDVNSSKNYEDKTYFVSKDSERNINCYDDYVKSSLINAINEEFSAFTFDDVTKIYSCTKILGNSEYTYKYKFSRNLFSSIKYKTIDSSSGVPQTQSFDFEYNKETADPYVDPVKKNFENIELSTPILSSGVIYTTTVSATDESGSVHSPNIKTLQIYCTNPDQGVHVKFDTDESDPSKITITLLDDYFHAGNTIEIQADCLDSQANAVTLTVQ